MAHVRRILAMSLIIATANALCVGLDNSLFASSRSISGQKIQAGQKKPNSATKTANACDGKTLANYTKVGDLDVCPGSLQVGSTQDVSWIGGDSNALKQVLGNFNEDVAYLTPATGNATDVPAIKVGVPDQQGTAVEFRAKIEIPAGTQPGTYVLHSSSATSDAMFKVVAANPPTVDSTAQKPPSPASGTVHLDPPMSAPGQTVDVRISGGNFADLAMEQKTEQLVPSNYLLFWAVSKTVTDCAVSLHVTDIRSDDSSVTLRISVPPDSLPGNYQLYYEKPSTSSPETGNDGGAGADKNSESSKQPSTAPSRSNGASDGGASKKSGQAGKPAPTHPPSVVQNTCGIRSAVDVSFAVGTAALGEYSNCPLTPFSDTNVDLLCSQSLLTYKEERDVFGKAVADEYLSVEIKVQNRNMQYPFLLSDVRIGRTTAMLTTSRDRTFVRTFAEKGEIYSARAIAMRAFEAASAILGGIGPAVGNTVLSNAIQIVQGPTGSALRNLFPDRSVQEEGFISDNGFSVVQTTVIPARAPIRVFCFVPQRTLLDYKLSEISDDVSPWQDDAQIKVLTKQLKQAKKKGDEDNVSALSTKIAQLETPDDPTPFRTLQSSLIVEIAGMHVTQVNTNPAITGILPDSDSAASGKAFEATLTGSGFDQIRFIQIGDSTNARFAVKPVPGSATAATVTIDPAKITNPTKGDSGSTASNKLTVYLVTTTGQLISTSTTFTLAAATPAKKSQTDEDTPQQQPAAEKPQSPAIPAPNPAPAPVKPSAGANNHPTNNQITNPAPRAHPNPN